MQTEPIEIPIDVLDKATDDFKKLGASVDGLAGKSVQANKKQAFSFTELTSAIGLARQGIELLKKGYDFAKEGAQIEFQKERFDRLAVSIGTTGDVLLGKMKDATKGTLSDLEAMASATDLLSLGLAKNQEEAVRLATVQAGLAMDTNQLVLALTNQTTARFDQLGVSVDGFKDKVKALEEQGYSTNDAFKEAFLQQAEAQLERVGNAADSSAGQFAKLEASWKNIADASKEFAAVMALPFIEQANKNIEESGAVLGLLRFGLDDVAVGIKDLVVASRALELGIFDDLYLSLKDDVAGQLHDVATGIKDIVVASRALELGVFDDLYLSVKNLVAGQNELTGSAQGHVASLGEIAVAAEKATMTQDEFNKKLDGLRGLMSGDLGNAQDDYIKKVEELRDKYREAQTVAEEQNILEQIQEETAAYEERANAIIFNIQQQAILAAVQSGSVDTGEAIQAISALAESYGLIDEATRRATEATAGLVDMWENGSISTDTFVETLEAQKNRLAELPSGMNNVAAASDPFEQKTRSVGKQADDTAMSLTDFADATGAMADDISSAATPAVADLAAQLNRLPPTGTTWSYSVSITTSGSVPNLPGGGGGSGSPASASNAFNNSYASQYANQHATGTGGDWLTVPSGFMNDNYNVGLSSGERYKVMRPGETDSGGGDSFVININTGPINDMADINTLAYRIMEVVKERSR